MNPDDEIRELLARYEQALNAGDAELAVSCYAPDGLFMPTQAPTARGTAELRATYEQIFGTIRLAVRFEISEIVLDDEFAYALTASHGTQTVLATGAQTPESNREIFVFVPQPGWKISRYMFNKPE